MRRTEVCPARACRRERLRLRTALAAALFIGAIAGAGARAQSVEDLGKLSIEDLAHLEVTSVTKSPEPVSRAAAAVYVITADDIVRSGATNLPEVLRLAPNLEVARLNAYNWAITARGFNSPESDNKLLVQIDGRSVYSPLADTVFWDQVDVPLDNIERIEVISGPGGTLYGANAVNGVINIITKDSHDTQGGLQDGGGGNQARQDTLRYGGRIGDDATYRVYGYGFDRASTPPYHGADIPSDAFFGGQTGFRVDGNSGANAYTMEGDLYDHSIVDNNGQFWGGNLNGFWSRRLENGSTVKLQAYYESDNQTVPSLLERLDTYDVQAQQNMKLGINQLVWGAEGRAWQEDLFSSGAFFFAQPTKLLWLGNVFAQDEISLRSNLVLTLGMKAEYYTFTGLSPLPNIRLGWQATPDVFFWTAVSRAIRTPSRIDRELEDPGFLAPSPNFETEKLTAYEVGYRGQPLPATSLSLSAYYNVYSNLRTDAFTNGGLPIVLMNGLAGNTYGIEAWATYSILEWWRLKPGVSWLHKNLQLNPGATDLSDLQSAGQDPAYQAQLRSEMNLSAAVELDASLRDVGRVSPSNVPSYVEADARLAWHATPATTFEIDGFNLLHPYHLEVFDPSTSPPRYIPRSVFFRMRASF
ncbi:MAG: TonB-dependent receptor plug domain-containing protein [Stellaceae bacterium]